MLSVKQAAVRLKISQALVYGWIADGLLVHYRLGRKGRRGKIGILEADHDALVASLRVVPKAPVAQPVKAVQPRGTFKHLKIT